MKVMVIGSGGREHTIAWKLSQSENVEEVICVPGNGGTALENKCANVNLDDCPYLNGITGNQRYAEIAKHENCELAVVGPEDPLATGAADAIWAAGIPTVGPKKAGAQLEASKDLAKVFMKKYGVACANSETFTDPKLALEYISKQGAPIVIKADGLAAGKGVVVAMTLEEAQNAVRDIMEDKKLGGAGSKIVVEEYLRGIEVSILAAVSVTPELAKEGKATIKAFQSARDHKRLMDGAKGPNTGGMGAISPVDDFTPELQAQFEETILKPTLKGLIEEGYDYRGFIFFGLMITKDGPKALEYNVRLGDPETQAVLPLMDFDFAEMCKSITEGTLKDFKLTWKAGYSVAPVAVSGGYPKAYLKGKTISWNPEIVNKNAKVFIAGAMNERRNKRFLDNKLMGLYTTGGRVLACSANGATFDEAWKKAYEAINAISFEGMFFRKDIGLPGAAESN